MLGMKEVARERVSEYGREKRRQKKPANTIVFHCSALSSLLEWLMLHSFNCNLFVGPFTFGPCLWSTVSGDIEYR